MKKAKEFNDNVTYYSLLVLLIIFMAGLAFLLMPLIMVGTPFTVYTIAFTTGIVFGLFIVFFVMDLDHLTHHHHAGIWLVILLGSIINFVAAYINKMPFIEEIKVVMPLNPANSFVTASVFALGFYLPYIIHLFNEHKLVKHAQKHSKLD